MIPKLPQHEIDIRVAHRLKRSSLLDREPPPAYEALVHEAALRMQFGGPENAGAQLHHLLEMSERDHITPRMVPFTQAASRCRADRSLRTGSCLPARHGSTGYVIRLHLHRRRDAAHQLPFSS
ncbi:DUF5753 domain-containing protein [Streptomyces gobiensis]|nr:Scr1 family TA system antitoxin-like transcriptional regulator [Streptomyces gobiensis]UGY94231.1 DUF5753 domain-containing protein [Streptomyces gobiensis]